MLILTDAQIRAKAHSIVENIEEDMAGSLKLAFNRLPTYNRLRIRERWMNIILDEFGLSPE